jgi:murein DD-endopeptidase MepM/ murein hydrolase activator NlpD
VEERAHLAAGATTEGVSRLRPTNLRACRRQGRSDPGVVAGSLEPQLVAGVAVPFPRGLRTRAPRPGALLGNHVVLDMGDGIFAVLAHLRHGSVKVKKGQRIRAGQPLAECGNSGNSSEPHIHFQLMDNPRTALAAGLPFRFANYEMPKNGEPFVTD